MAGAQSDSDPDTLQTLSTFMLAVLAKKYTNPSSDIIELLAGLDHIDHVFTDFVGALESIIRTGRSTTHECCPGGIGHVGQQEPRPGHRASCTYTADLQQRAVEVALAVASGAYQTSLLTYFIQRDLFPAIISVGEPTTPTPTSFSFVFCSANKSQCIQSQIPSPTPKISSPFMLLGLLANYNKFEFQNPYQMRLNDFVNERVIRGIVKSVGQACQRLRAQYLDVQEDLPEGWSLAGTLSKIGLGAIAPGGKPPPKPVYDADTAKKMFAELYVVRGPRPRPPTNCEADESRLTLGSQTRARGGRAAYHVRFHPRQQTLQPGTSDMGTRKG